MPDKLVIEIYKKKEPEEFTKLLADPHSRLEVGSAAALTAASAAALLERAAMTASEENKDNERLAYILKNSETIRGYMVCLIDEDVKCRGPIRKAIKEGDEGKIDACRQSASCIAAEIINMSGHLLGFLHELAELCPKSALHYLSESAHLAVGAAESCREYILQMASGSGDETYRFVTVRENELTFDELHRSYELLISNIKNKG